MPYPCDFLHNCSIEKNAETLRLSLSRSLRLSLSLSLSRSLYLFHQLSSSQALESSCSPPCCSHRYSLKWGKSTISFSLPNARGVPARRCGAERQASALTRTRISRRPRREGTHLPAGKVVCTQQKKKDAVLRASSRCVSRFSGSTQKLVGGRSRAGGLRQSMIRWGDCSTTGGTTCCCRAASRIYPPACAPFFQGLGMIRLRLLWRVLAVLRYECCLQAWTRKLLQ